MMRLPFFRRNHQRLTADSDEKDNVPELTRRSSDESSGSESVQSFDPNNYTVDEFISAAEEASGSYHGRMKSAGLPPLDQSIVSEPTSARRLWLPRRKARPPVEEKAPTAGRTNDAARSTPSQAREPDRASFSSRSEGFTAGRSELDRAMSSLRSNGTVSEKSHSSSKETKRRTKHGTDIQTDTTRAVWNKSKELHQRRAADDELDDMLRAETWVRRVSSLEACFRKESEKKKKVDEKALESVIMKVISFGSDERKPKSRESSVNSALTDDVYGQSDSLPGTATSASTKSTRKSKEQSVKPRFTTSMGKNDASGRGFLNRVPDWSVGTSSGEVYTATTSDDETSVSGNRQRRRRTWSPERRSVSSIDDDDFSDDQFLGGCNPAQPCEVVSRELRFLFKAVIPRDVNCTKSPTRKTRRRSKK